MRGIYLTPKQIIQKKKDIEVRKKKGKQTTHEIQKLGRDQTNLRCVAHQLFLRSPPTSQIPARGTNFSSRNSPHLRPGFSFLDLVPSLGSNHFPPFPAPVLLASLLSWESPKNSTSWSP
jgi:hypothetical protein